MATKKRGVLTTSREWWEHLRWSKRRFWKAERQAGKAEAGELVGDDCHTGSSFDSFLEEEGILEEVEAAARKLLVPFPKR